MVPARLPGELGWFLHFNMCNFRLISLLTWEYHLGFNMLQIFKQQTGQRCSHDERKVSVPRLYEDLFVTLFNPVLLKILEEKRDMVYHSCSGSLPCVDDWHNLMKLFCLKTVLLFFAKEYCSTHFVSNHSIFQQKHWTEPEIKHLPFFPTEFLKGRGNPVFITNHPPAYLQPHRLSSTEVSDQGWGFLWLWRSSRCKSSSRRWGACNQIWDILLANFGEVVVFFKDSLGWIGWDMGSMTFWDVFIPLMSKMFLGVFPWNLGSMGFFSLLKLEKMISQFDLRRIFNFWLRRCLSPN